MRSFTTIAALLFLDCGMALTAARLTPYVSPAETATMPVQGNTHRAIEMIAPVLGILR